MPSSCCGSAHAAVGQELHVLGGLHRDLTSPKVWVFDCRFNTWRPGPSMRVARVFAVAGAVDGKIYVMGGCGADTADWAEALDPRTGAWAAVPSPARVREGWIFASSVVDGKVHALADRGGGVMYDPRKEMWARAASALDPWRPGGCVIGGILYCYDNYPKKIQGFDLEEGAWKELKGVGEGLPGNFCGVTMVNVGGNLVVVWEGDEAVNNHKAIWCSEVAVTKEQNGELACEVCWSELVLAVPLCTSVVQCVAVEL